MCRDGFREKCLGCRREVSCRDDFPFCEDPCNFGMSDHCTECDGHGGVNG